MKKPLLAFLVKVIALASSFFASDISYGQVQGCTDPLANNYNASATVNDGSCTYNVTNYTPPVKVNQISNTLKETSGLQMADNFLWSFNDGGGAAAIFRIDTITGTILQTVNLSGKTNVDWEDIAFDGTNFFIGDFGNNSNGARTNLRIYKFPISAIPGYAANPIVNIPADQIQVINFKYSDQPVSPVATSSNNTKFDCEAMIVDGGIIHLFTKNWVDTNTTHYILNNITEPVNIATPVETLATGYLVTGADKAVGRETVALLGYQNSGFGSHFMHLLTDYSGGKYFNGNKRKLNLGTALELGQSEGIAFRNSTYGYISNEAFYTISQKLRFFDIGNFVSNNNQVLAINFSTIKAFQNKDDIQVEWSVGSDKNISHFIIQKSLDSRNFKQATSVSINGSDSYKWIDVNPSIGSNFYRVKGIEKNGQEKLSAVVVVKMVNNKSAIKVFENPVKNRIVQLKFENQEQGNYLVQLYNSNGQRVSSSTINHPAGSIMETVPLKAGIVKGVYQLKVSNGQNRTIQQIVVE